MSLPEDLKGTLKIIRWRLRRAVTSLRHGPLDSAPIFFANSFPKSGTHLLIQVMKAFSKIGLAVDSGLPAVLTYDGPTGQPRSPSTILRDLQRLRPGDVSYGHLHALPQVVSLLTRHGMATFFIYRDPRDVVVSHVHYVTEMEPNHVHHDFYRYTLKTFDERLRVSILGRPGLATPFPDIRGRFDPYLGWLEHPKVLSLQFEDFVTNQDATLLKILDYAKSRGFSLDVDEHHALQILKASIDPALSPTFRSGKVGKWREAFTEEHITLFKEVSGDLLVRLGYEQSQNW
jgi:hypothetical protein